MVFLLDSTAISAAMAQGSGVLQRLQSASPQDRVVTSVIVRGEVLFGIQRLAPGRRRTMLAENAARTFAGVPCEPIPVAAADCYAELKAGAWRRGVSLDENDLWIAATAVTLGAVVVTSDADFTRLDGVRVENWMES